MSIQRPNRVIASEGKPERGNPHTKKRQRLPRAQSALAMTSWGAMDLPRFAFARLAMTENEFYLVT